MQSKARQIREWVRRNCPVDNLDEIEPEDAEYDLRKGRVRRSFDDPKPHFYMSTDDEPAHYGTFNDGTRGNILSFSESGQGYELEC